MSTAALALRLLEIVTMTHATVDQCDYAPRLRAAVCVIVGETSDGTAFSARVPARTQRVAREGAAVRFRALERLRKA